jgi:hypothetical protein
VANSNTISRKERNYLMGAWAAAYTGHKFHINLKPGMVPFIANNCTASQ